MKRGYFSANRRRGWREGAIGVTERNRLTIRKRQLKEKESRQPASTPS